MSGTRVVLITAAGPGGQVDIGVRSDATPKDLVSSLGSVIGVVQGSSVVEHHAPPRPGVPQGRRTQLTSNASLADSGVADGDMIIFRKSASEEHAVGPGQRPGPAEVSQPAPVGGERPGAEKIYRPAHQRPGSEQWHQLGSTRGTDSDEPDDRP